MSQNNYANFEIQMTYITLNDKNYQSVGKGFSFYFFKTINNYKSRISLNLQYYKR